MSPLTTNPGRSPWTAVLCLGILVWASGSTRAEFSEAADSPWESVDHLAPAMPDPPANREHWEERDVHFYRSALTPGILLRMKSRSVTFFGDLDRYGAEAPSFFVIPTTDGPRSFASGEIASGALMAASWIVTSFQGRKGWEQFDVPWFIALQRRPREMTLTAEGLHIEFSEGDSGYLFSMPLYGYYKPPQEDNDFAARHGLPSPGVQPWNWASSMPAAVVERCNWWARVAKAFPVGFQESFSVDPGNERLTIRQEYRWLQYEDDWGTPPRRFATVSPSLGLAWKYGFPLRSSAKLKDPEYFTAFGPFVGALDVDRLEISMEVLQYTNQLERLPAPSRLTTEQGEVLELIVDAMSRKFRSGWRYFLDHGSRENLCWNVVGDVWYPRALPFVDPELRERAESALRIYLQNDVLRPHSPYHGKYLLHGPGVGSWGGSGDAGKFMTNTLQFIWAYGQFTGDWKLIGRNWELIQRFFVTPDEAGWLSFGRQAIAELGDEAAPCSAYARMAWAVQDRDEYLLGSYMFARELVHHFVKQRAGAYFYNHQPYNQFKPMPKRIYPTDIWGETRGWQVDGPTWGHLSSGEHQSANRWMRFHDPDVGRFYRDHLAEEVREELDWYSRAAIQLPDKLYNSPAYVDWLTQEKPHNLTSLARLRSFLLGESYPQLSHTVDYSNYRSDWPAARIALGYAYLRTMVPIRHDTLVEAPPSPFVLGLQRRGLQDAQTSVQALWDWGIALEPRWLGWKMPRAPVGEGTDDRSFGTIHGEFEGRVTGAQDSQWLSYACSVSWADAVVPRQLTNAAEIRREQSRTEVAVVGPFPNLDDNEITETGYPPETEEFSPSVDYPGRYGPVRWKVRRLGAGRRLDLGESLLEPDQDPRWNLAYVQQYVWSPRSMQAYLLAGHQGGLAAWVNGSLALREHSAHHRFQPDAERALVALKQGWNRILIKTESFDRNFHVQFRIVHLDRLPIPELKYAATLPQDPGISSDPAP